MVTAVATKLGVDTSAVTLQVGAASVILTFTIAFPSARDAKTGATALSAQLATPTAASAFLKTDAYTPSVESIPVAPTVVNTAPASSVGSNVDWGSAGSHSTVGAIVGGAVGGFSMAFYGGAFLWSALTQA